MSEEIIICRQKQDDFRPDWCQLEAMRRSLRELQKENEAFNAIAEIIHYPKCWDTIAYPTLFHAIIEFLPGCNVCFSENKT